MWYFLRMPIFIIIDNKIVKLIRVRIRIHLLFLVINLSITFIFSCEEILTYFLHILKPTSPSTHIFIFIPIFIPIPIPIHMHICTRVCMLTGVHNLFTSSFCSYSIITWRTRLGYRLSTFFITYWKLLYFLFVLDLLICSWSERLFCNFVYIWSCRIFGYNFAFLAYFYYSFIFVLLVM